MESESVNLRTYSRLQSVVFVNHIVPTLWESDDVEWRSAVGWHRGRRLFPSVTGRRRANYAGRAESSEGGSDCEGGGGEWQKPKAGGRTGQAGGGVLDGRENVKNPSRRGQLRIGPLGNRERERERERTSLHLGTNTC